MYEQLTDYSTDPDTRMMFSTAKLRQKIESAKIFRGKVRNYFPEKTKIYSVSKIYLVLFRLMETICYLCSVIITERWKQTK